MISSKKGVSVGIVLSLIAGLAVLALLLNAMGFFKNADKDINSATSCNTTFGGSCVSASSSCKSVALKGYGCQSDKPFCCQDNQYNKCSATTWNTCESCKVKTMDATVVDTPQNGKPFKLKCVYSANNVPCAKMTLTRNDNVPVDSSLCAVSKHLGVNGEIVYDCPGTLLPGTYKLTCSLNAKGAQGVDEKNTCCASEGSESKVKEFTIS